MAISLSHRVELSSLVNKTPIKDPYRDIKKLLDSKTLNSYDVFLEFEKLNLLEAHFPIRFQWKCIAYFLHENPEYKQKILDLESDFIQIGRWMNIGLDESLLEHFEDANWLLMTGLAYDIQAFANSDTNTPGITITSQGLQILVEGKPTYCKDLQKRFSLVQREYLGDSLDYLKEDSSEREFTYLSPNGLCPLEKFVPISKLTPVHVLSQEKYNHLLKRARSYHQETNEHTCIVMPYFNSHSIHSGLWVINEKRELFSFGLSASIDESESAKKLRAAFTERRCYNLCSANAFASIPDIQMFIIPNSRRITTPISIDVKICHQLLQNLKKEHNFRYNKVVSNCCSFVVKHLKACNIANINILRPLRNLVFQTQLFKTLPVAAQNVITNLALRCTTASKGTKKLDSKQFQTLLEMYPNMTDEIPFHDPELLEQWIQQQPTTYVSSFEEDGYSLGITLPDEYLD